MADDKKNIPDAGKVDDPPKPGKVEPVKADPPVQDQPALAKAEAPVTEDVSKVVTPPTTEKPVEGKTVPDPAAEQPAPVGKEAPNAKDAPAPSKEGVPQPGKDEKQTTIPGMGDPAPAGRWWILLLPGKERRRASPRKKLRPRIRASRRIKRRMRPSPAGAAHPRLTRKPPTRPSRNLGTKCPKANRLPGKTLPPLRRARLQLNSRPPLGMLPVA